MVRNRKALGFKFKRQHPVASYYVDFYCHEANLVIELDTDVNDLENVKKRDEFREVNIKSLGLTVMRFTNDDVFKNAHLVIDEIEKYLKSISFKQ